MEGDWPVPRYEVVRRRGESHRGDGIPQPYTYFEVVDNCYVRLPAVRITNDGATSIAAVEARANRVAGRLEAAWLAEDAANEAAEAAAA